MSKDLSEMSLEELRSLAKDVAIELARKEGERLSQARKALEQKAREFGTSIEELFGKKPESQKSKKTKPSKSGKKKKASKTVKKTEAAGTSDTVKIAEPSKATKVVPSRKTTRATKPTKKARASKKKILYIDDEGKEWARAKSAWTDAQKKKYRSNLEKAQGAGA
jgi:hypothetical protein